MPRVAAARNTGQFESSMTRAIIQTFNAIDGVICQKIKGTAYGMPTLDIMGSKHGRFFWLEVKRPGRKPTLRQFSTINLWIENEAVAIWCTSLDAARRFITIDWNTLTPEQMIGGFHDE